MGYIENNLQPGEKVVYKTEFHWIINLWSYIFLFTAICSFAVAIISIAIGATEHGNLIWLGFMLGSLLLSVSFTLNLDAWLKSKTAEFGVTNKRIIMKVGFFQKDSLEVSLNEIKLIEVKRGALCQSFDLDYGTFKIYSTIGTKGVYHKINMPYEFKKQIESARVKMGTVVHAQ